MSFSRHVLSDEKGFTIQELLVVLFVGMLLVTLSLSVFLFASKLLHTWQQKSVVHSLLNRSINTIAHDVICAKALTECSDSTLVLVMSDGRRISYYFALGTLSRNGTALFSHDGDVQCELRFAEHPIRPGLGKNRLVNIHINGKSKTTNYSVETDVSFAPSSRVEFVAALNSVGK